MACQVVGLHFLQALRLPICSIWPTYVLGRAVGHAAGQQAVQGGHAAQGRQAVQGWLCVAANGSSQGHAPAQRWFRVASSGRVANSGSVMFASARAEPGPGSRSVMGPEPVLQGPMMMLASPACLPAR